MKKLFFYFKFLRENGRQLSEINPGSDEICLTVENALHALELLKESETAILGGDIISEIDNELIYAYQHWGQKFHYLNWYCDKFDGESKIDYFNRSYNKAKESIFKANEIAVKLDYKCFIVLVI